MARAAERAGAEREEWARTGFAPGYDSRRHFLEKHKKTGNLQLKREHLLNQNTARIVNVDLG